MLWNSTIPSNGGVTWIYTGLNQVMTSFQNLKLLWILLGMAAYTVEKKPEFDDRYKTNLKIDYSEAELNELALKKFKEE